MMNKKMLVAPLLIAFSLTLAGAQAQGTAAKPKPQVVAVKLSEWTMGIMDTTVKGSAQFEISNEGKYPHLMSLQGKVGGKDVMITSAYLKPGEKTTLTVSLPAGLYTVYCPVPGHADQGMKGTLTFQ